MTTTVIFDLDDTLMVELESNDQAFLATCRRAEERFGVDAEALREAIRDEAEQLWRDGPLIDYCDAIGMASWEGLWGDFSGDHPNFKVLSKWIPSFCLQAWSRALAGCGVQDPDVAEQVSVAFRAERRVRHRLFPEAREVLEACSQRCRLALLTNGVPDIQWTKIRAVDLESHFQAVVISGEVGVGKPDRAIFELTLERMGAVADEAVMVGNSLRRDIAGAKGAGVRAIWMNSTDPEAAVQVVADEQIGNLKELLELI